MTWLADAVAAIEDDPTKIRRLFPAAAREVGVENGDAARITLIAALGERRADELADLYRFGDAAERRAILLSMRTGRGFRQLSTKTTTSSEDVDLRLAKEAFRSNEPELVVAAANASIVQKLTDDEVDQVIVKCVFMEIPLAKVPALIARTTASTSRMLAALILERVTAGRSIAADVWAVIDRYPPRHELELIEQQLQSPILERRQAAEAALSIRT